MKLLLAMCASGWALAPTAKSISQMRALGRAATWDVLDQPKIDVFAHCVNAQFVETTACICAYTPTASRVQLHFVCFKPGIGGDQKAACMFLLRCFFSAAANHADMVLCAGAYCEPWLALEIAWQPTLRA